MAITLKDLEPAIGVAVCKTSYGREVRIPFRTLSYEEWDTHGREVADPKVPKFKQTDGTVMDKEDDPIYLQKKNRAGEDRQARRLFASLDVPDGLEIPGDTALEKWDVLKQQDQLLVNQLIATVLYQAQLSGKATVEAVAESFREKPVQPDDATDLQAVHPNGVAEPHSG